MEEKNNEMRTCPYCGHEITEENRFCPQCKKEQPQKNSEEQKSSETSPNTIKPSPATAPVEKAPITEVESSPETASLEETPSQETAIDKLSDPPIKQQTSENGSTVKKRRKKIIITSVSAAALLVLIVGIIIATVSGNKISGSFDKETAISFDAYGLICYAPKGWTIKDDAAYFYDKNSTGVNDYQASISVVYFGEYDSFNDVLKDNADYYNKESSTRTKIENCKAATITDYATTDGNYYAHAYIVLCDRSAFWIGCLATEKYYDTEEFDKMILASDFEDYTSSTICEYLGGHRIAEDAEWEVTQESTCTKKGTEETKCPVCLQMVTRELPLLDHSIEDGETIESTCVEKGSVTGICTICNKEVSIELPLAEHTYGDWIITKEATESSAGTHHKECTVCGKKTEDESFTLSLEEIKDTYDTGITYNQLSRTPDEYEGKKVKFKGRVLQVIEGNYGMTSLRVATSGRYDNVIYVKYLSSIVESRVLEDDTITIYGTSEGLMSYESTGSGTITIPSISVDYIN